MMPQTLTTASWTHQIHPAGTWGPFSSAAAILALHAAAQILLVSVRVDNSPTPLVAASHEHNKRRRVVFVQAVGRL